jgi:hypothetical protein
MGSRGSVGCNRQERYMGFHMIWGNVTHLAPALLNSEVIVWSWLLGLPSMLGGDK